MRKVLIIPFLLICLLVVASQGVNGQFYLEEDSVSIDFDDEGEPTTAPEPSPTPTKIPVRDHVLYGEEKERFEKDGFLVRTQLPYSTGVFSLQTGFSSIKAEFNSLQPNIAEEKTVTIEVRSEGLFSYQTLAWQTDVLRSANNLTIQNTQCDRVREACSTTYARPWTSPDAGGFGYRLTGFDRPIDFDSGVSYRVFPVAFTMPAAVLFNDSVVTGKRTGEIVLKIIPPPSYQEGAYTTDLEIITIPRP